MCCCEPDTDHGQTTRTLANGRRNRLVPGLTGQVTVGWTTPPGGRQILLPHRESLGKDVGERARAGCTVRTTIRRRCRTLLTYRKQVGENHSLEWWAGTSTSKFTKTVAMGQASGSSPMLSSTQPERRPSLQDSSDGNESRLVSFLSRASTAQGISLRHGCAAIRRIVNVRRGAQWALFPGLSASWHLTRGVPAQRAVLGPAPAGRLGASRQSGHQALSVVAHLVGGTGAAYPFSPDAAAGPGAIPTGASANPNSSGEHPRRSARPRLGRGQPSLRPPTQHPDCCATSVNAPSSLETRTSGTARLRRFRGTGT